MAELAEVSRRDGAQPVLDALAADGAVIVRDFLEPGLLDRFRADMVTHAADHHAGTIADNVAVRAFWGDNTKRFTRLAHRSPAFVEILTDPYYLSVADALLLGSTDDYWMNTGQMMIVGPGSTDQRLHRDADNWPVMNSPTSAEATVSTMFALSEFTVATGATKVVPGSHRWDDYERLAEPHEIAHAVMPAGAGMIYTGRVLHGAGANTTADEWRYGLHLSYVLGWLTPEEASPLGAGWDDVRHLSVVAQRLLGWRCSGVNNRFAARLWTIDYEDIPAGLGIEHT